MGRTAKPRKAYRPRPIGRPVMKRMRDDLVLPCYSALEMLRSSDDAEALESARHSLAAALDYIYIAAEGRDRQAGADGLAALASLIERHGRTGVYRCTGPELEALRGAVAWMDGVLPYLNTAQIAAAILAVHKELAI